MNRFTVLALCSLLSVPALAQDGGYGPGYGGGPYGRYDDQRQPQYGWSEAHGKRYVNIGAEVCGVRQVRILVQGDNVNINDLDVLFGNNATQDIRVRTSFSPGQASRWIDLPGDERCIKGFFLDASGDRDRHNATVTLQAVMAQYDYAVNISEPVLIRDFRRYRR